MDHIHVHTKSVFF